MTTKIPKTSSKGAKKKLTDDELPEERITLRTVLDAVVNIHSRLNRIEFEVKAIAAKAAAEARELAMPLEFGTRVKWGTFTGRVACEGPDHENQYLVAYKPGHGSVWHSKCVRRRDLTIIP